MSNRIDNVLIQVRGLLQERGIKLWLPPFYVEEVGCCEIELENLATDFSSTLGLSFEYCLTAVKELQSGALEKLEARAEFQKTGIASLKVKVLLNPGNSQSFNVKIRLSDNGKDLSEKIAQKVSIDAAKLKIIFSGRVIDPVRTLLDQGLTNNQQIMALALEPVSAGGNNEVYDRVRKAREDAELVLESSSQNFLRMEDQDGNAVHLPPNEKKKILMALALHEKGRSAMKREDYNEALVLFLEADEEFFSSNSQILESVDNYALLNLDIVWCYLCLQSITHLSDAQRRLDICEQSFRRSYGRNLDRVVAVKGGSENERALIMRLHLLQGVMLYHQNKRNEAKTKLQQAQSELRGLKLDDVAIATLLEMGYSPGEARTALRACNNNVDQAVQYIMDRREKKLKARKRAREEHKLEKKSNKSEGWVNPRTAHTLVQMGYDEAYVFAALRKTDNDLYQAIDYLTNRRNELVPEKLENVAVDQDLVDAVVKMGFNPEMAKIALELALNNSAKAIDMLLQSQSGSDFAAGLQSVITGIDSSNNPLMPSTSSSSQENAASKESEQIKSRLKNEVEAMKAYGRFAQDLTEEDDEYLDLTLTQEEQLLFQYIKYVE